MGKFDAYRIDLKGMKESSCRYEFVLDNQFFADIEGQDVQKGKVNVSLDIKKTGSSYELDFQINGTVWVLCDRCLDEMELPVRTSGHLYVKSGDEYSEEDDDVIIVPIEEGAVNVAWFMYEFVALAIPIKHVHPDGMCNEEMSRKLREHLCKDAGDYSEEDSSFSGTEGLEDVEGKVSYDPRWSELKKLLDNN